MRHVSTTAAVAVTDAAPTEEDEKPQSIIEPVAGILTTESDKNSTVAICPYEIAMHRWHLFSETACEELKSDFRSDELHEIRKHFDASSFRMNRNDLTALQQDILQCQNLREFLAFNMGGLFDSDTAFRRKKLANVFDDILDIKRRHYRKQARKTESPELPPELSGSTSRGKPRTWPKDDDDSSDSVSSYYSEDSQQPETSASIKAQDTLAEIQCLQELLMAKHHLDAETYRFHKEIGCPQHYADPDFLHKCLPSHYPRGIAQGTLNKAIPFIKGEHTHSGRHAPTIFLLTSTNPSTQAQFTQTHDDLTIHANP